jgi:hypothetical protein
VPVLLYPRTEECRLDLGKTLLAKLYTTEPPPLPPGRFRVVGLGARREGERLEVEVRPNLGEAFTLCLSLGPSLADASFPLGQVLEVLGSLGEDLSLLAEEVHPPSAS